jgi:hypothetical protein
MGLRLHTGGRFRTWLGARFGGDFQLGDRLWRRIMHGLGAGVVLYYLFPDPLLGVVPKNAVLLGALGTVLVIEGLRHAVGLGLPTLRPYEAGRVGSYVFFSVALVAAILLFPRPIATAVVLGTAIVDPIVGEIRLRPGTRRLYPALPFVLYVVLAFGGMVAWGTWPVLPSIGLAVVAAAVALLMERPKIPWVDDDLAMTLVPALVLLAFGVYGFGLPR